MQRRRGHRANKRRCRGQSCMAPMSLLRFLASTLLRLGSSAPGEDLGPPTPRVVIVGPSSPTLELLIPEGIIVTSTPPASSAPPKLYIGVSPCSAIDIGSTVRASVDIGPTTQPGS
ncbi:hypothetical protein AALP_AA8G292700 [Arabis alpina]|uniref:Secreted protein n=1 Tax=Arabis alpina TaxID=50452 RepID=A0A087GA79_ARAAL|nr:hypothetical protein AALP_AA8G292700 [Arabis alpina]